MTLQQLLSTFDITVTDITATVMDGDNGLQIVKLSVSGYESLDDELELREVKSWTITSRTSITITVR